jgi:hypothetical protein
MTERLLAWCREYSDLMSTLNAWVVELGVAKETVDDIAGIPLRHTARLLAPMPPKGLGPKSFGPLMGALGLKVGVFVDAEQFERIKHRLKSTSEIWASATPLCILT